MNDYPVTIRYVDNLGVNQQLYINVYAMTRTDACIQGAGKAYALFSGSEYQLFSVAVGTPADSDSAPESDSTDDNTDDNTGDNNGVE